MTKGLLKKLWADSMIVCYYLHILFDQFESYEERGDQFKSIVGSLNLEKFSNRETTT